MMMFLGWPPTQGILALAAGGGGARGGSRGRGASANQQGPAHSGSTKPALAASIGTADNDSERSDPPRPDSLPLSNSHKLSPKHTEHPPSTHTHTHTQAHAPHAPMCSMGYEARVFSVIELTS